MYPEAHPCMNRTSRIFHSDVGRAEGMGKAVGVDREMDLIVRVVFAGSDLTSDGGVEGLHQIVTLASPTYCSNS